MRGAMNEQSSPRCPRSLSGEFLENGIFGNFISLPVGYGGSYRKPDFTGRRQGNLSSWVDLGGQVHELLSGFLPAISPNASPHFGHLMM
jgi:hypothetical protein